MGNFCEQYGLPPITPSRQKSKKHDKSHKKYKKYRNNFVKPNDFCAKKKNVSKKYVKQKSGKGKCFNCGKSGHFSKDCKQRLGNLKNKLNIDDSSDSPNIKLVVEVLVAMLLKLMFSPRVKRIKLWKNLIKRNLKN